MNESLQDLMAKVPSLEGADTTLKNDIYVYLVEKADSSDACPHHLSPLTMSLMTQGRDL